MAWMICKCIMKHGKGFHYVYLHILNGVEALYVAFRTNSIAKVYYGCTLNMILEVIKMMRVVAVGWCALWDSRNRLRGPVGPAVVGDDEEAAGSGGVDGSRPMAEMAWSGGGVAAFRLAVAAGRGATRRRKHGFFGSGGGAGGGE